MGGCGGGLVGVWRGEGVQPSKLACNLTNGPWLKQLGSLSGRAVDKSLHMY